MSSTQQGPRVGSSDSYTIPIGATADDLGKDVSDLLVHLQKDPQALAARDRWHLSIWFILKQYCRERIPAQPSNWTSWHMMMIQTKIDHLFWGHTWKITLENRGWPVVIKLSTDDCPCLVKTEFIHKSPRQLQIRVQKESEKWPDYPVFCAGVEVHSALEHAMHLIGLMMLDGPLYTPHFIEKPSQSERDKHTSKHRGVRDHLNRFVYGHRHYDTHPYTHPGADTAVHNRLLCRSLYKSDMRR